jgi:hypothetical protein
LAGRVVDVYLTGYGLGWKPRLHDTKKIWPALKRCVLGIFRYAPVQFAWIIATMR